MNQLGLIFRDARIKSGKTIEEASRETKIAKKYLIAIENENFDIFPGETYLIGFLRNYAQFLELDSDELVLKYRDFKIQEQPAPIEQLTARPKSSRKFFLIAFVFIMIISGALYFVLNGKKEERPVTRDREKPEEQKKTVSGKTGERVIVFEEEEVIKDFKKGDIIEFSQRNMKYTISIDGINEHLDFSIGSIPFSLSTDERVEIDFDRDGRKDLLLRANRLGEGSVNLTLRKLYRSELLDSEISPSTDYMGEAAAAGTAGPPEVVIIKEDDLLAKIPVAPKTGFQIVSSYEKTAIKTLVKVSRTAYFAYIIDEKDKEEALLKNGEELSFTAKEALRIMAANASDVNLEINNIPVTLGKRGEVVAKVVRWYRDSENNDLYHLIIDDWEN
ncbi:MAG: helix-turn-helix domain-containing protein [Spirochaetes bacterium]|nr:helix-turn-helix domain-containing protein [Spirochaetota bacterium]